MLKISPICFFCEYFLNKETGEHTCKAFPEGIPEEKLMHSNDRLIGCKGKYKYLPGWNCFYCDKYLGARKCLAFPDEIPDKIFNREMSQPEVCNNGLGFKIDRKTFQDMLKLYKG